MHRQHLNIRLSLISDLPEIDDIYNQAIKIRATAHLHPLSKQERLDWFIQHDPKKYPVFVAEIDGKVAGWLSISPYRPGRMALRYTAEISYYVHEDHCRKGIGTKLMEHALKQAPQLNNRQIFAIVLEHNTASIRLLKNFGFLQWGFLPEVADFNGKKCGQFYYGRSVSS
jgi:L-amino acid N-acyltransferase YncA